MGVCSALFVDRSLVNLGRCERWEGGQVEMWEKWEGGEVGKVGGG